MFFKWVKTLTHQLDKHFLMDGNRDFEPFFHVKIWSHLIDSQPFLKWMFQVPGLIDSNSNLRKVKYLDAQFLDLRTTR